MRVLVLSDHIGAQISQPSGYGTPDVQFSSAPIRSGIPTVRRLREFDAVVVVGQPQGHDSAVQLGGVLSLAVEAGVTAVIAYQAVLRDQMHALINRITPVAVADLPSGLGEVTAAHPAFREFFTAFSLTATAITEMPAEARPLGVAPSAEHQITTAFHCPVGEGAVYVVPFHRVEAFVQTVDSLVRAVLEYRTDSLEPTLPAFLDELRLPREQALLDEMSAIEIALDAKRREAQRLQRFRLLLGSASGDPLEQLVLNALGVVLEGTGVRPEDRPDVGREDFWLVDSGGERALGEAKGIGSHVRRRDVSQVEQHRADLDLDPDALPGLLVVNIFRNATSLEQRALPPSDDVIRQASRLNVVVLRTFDLFNLLSARLEGNDGVGGALLDGLSGGGGWLEARDGRIRVHRR